MCKAIVVNVSISDVQIQNLEMHFHLEKYPSSSIRLTFSRDGKLRLSGREPAIDKLVAETNDGNCTSLSESATSRLICPTDSRSLRRIDVRLGGVPSLPAMVPLILTTPGRFKDPE